MLQSRLLQKLHKYIANALVFVEADFFPCQKVIS